MNKELTPEEKKQFGLGDTNTTEAGGLTPEQIAKNLENQKNIKRAQEASQETTPSEVPGDEIEPETQDEVLDLDTSENETISKQQEDDPEQQPIEGVPQDTAEESAGDESDIIDLDNVLDKAEHTYEIEKDTIEAAPSISQGTTESLEERLAETEPVNPMQKALEEQAAANKTEHIQNTPQKDTHHVRTFHKDVSQLKNTGNTAITSQMLREAHQEEREKTAEAKAGSQIKTLSIFGAVLIVIAIGVIMYATRAKQPSTVSLTTTDTIPSLLPADIQIPIDVTNALHFKIKSTLAEKIAEQTELKQLAHFYFGKASRGGGMLLSTHEFFNALNIEVPTMLLDATTDQFMFGTYTLDKPHPFLILPITSFPKAQQAMSAWEGSMLRDLKDVFAIPSEYTEPEAFNSVFRHDIIDNQHVQLLYTPVIETIEETFILETPTNDEEVVEEELTEQASDTEEEGVVTDDNETSEEMIEETETGENIVEEEITGEIMTEENDQNEVVPEEETAEIEEEELTTQTEEEIFEPQPQTLTQTKRISNGENLTLLYTFINEYTLLITTDPVIIPEIVKRYTNRQIFLR